MPNLSKTGRVVKNPINSIHYILLAHEKAISSSKFLRRELSLHIYWNRLLQFSTSLEVMLPSPIIHQNRQLGLIAFFVTFVLITMARFGQVNIVSWVVNKFRPRNKITRDYNMVITYAGFRGAMGIIIPYNI